MFLEDDLLGLIVRTPVKAPTETQENNAKKAMTFQLVIRVFPDRHSIRSSIVDVFTMVC